jgi:hypothetical protein
MAAQGIGSREGDSGVGVEAVGVEGGRVEGEGRYFWEGRDE